MRRTAYRDRPAARQLVDRPVAVVMARPALTERRGFRWWQRAAMNRRSSIRAVAGLVISHRAPVTTRVSHGPGADGRPGPRTGTTPVRSITQGGGA